MRYAKFLTGVVGVVLLGMTAWAQQPPSSSTPPPPGGQRPNIPPPPPASAGTLPKPPSSPSASNPSAQPTVSQQTPPSLPPTQMPGADGGPPAGGPSTSLPTGTGSATPPSQPQPTGGPAAPAATDVATTNSSGEELVRLNVQDADIRDIIKQISLATGRNFILDDNVKGKITIISPRPVTKDDAYQTFLSALAVTGFTTVKGPAGVMKIVRLKDSVQYPIPTHIDSTPYTDSYVTRLIQMNNIGAVDMMGAIKALVSKDGNIYAYPATNTLIITDSGTNIDRLMKIIKELDQEGPQQALEIIPIHNALARDVSQTLTTLFKQEKQKTAPAKPGELEELDEVSNILADERTNSVIVLASKRAIEKVKGIIARLDSKVASGQEGKIHVYYLKYSKAKQLAETLAALTSGSGQKTTAAPGGTGGAPKIAEFEGGIKVGADEPTNSLIVTASAKDFQTLVDRVITKLDVPRRQVYIEAVVMELSLTKTRNIGVSSGGGAGGKGMIGFGQSFGATTNFAQNFLGAPSLLGGLISSRTTNITYLGSDGTTKTASVPAFTAFLTAVQTYGDANVISTPNILTVENEESVIEVKQDKPIPSATPASATSAVLTQSYTSKEVGLTLKVKPQISSNNSILLNVDEELSNFGPDVTFPGGYNIPTSKKRHIKTATVVGDGQTVVLGGLMEDQIRSTQEKVPLLGDIPLLGFFFKKTGKQVDKNNLIIFLTPHVMDDATDFSRILQAKIDQRNKFMEQNYGHKQQQIIRDTIKNHREDLLEFKAATEELPNSTFPTEYQKSTAVAPVPVTRGMSAEPMPAPTTKTKKSAPVYVPAPQQPSGVITVPSLSPGSPSASAYIPTSSPASAPVPNRLNRAPSMPSSAPAVKAAPSAPPAANPVPQSQPIKELNLTY